MKDVTAVILGGGKGTRLAPLTDNRAKPAVPIGGKYRLIDIPISNCINSNVKRIFVLTQYNSESLHRHISLTYHFGNFSNEFVQILAAQQTLSNVEWYQGTADAVRQNINYITHYYSENTLILSGDQLYHMDYQKLVERHRKMKADITIGVLPVSREDAKGFGILRTDKRGKIVEFHEKPKRDQLLDDLKLEDSVIESHGVDPKGRNYMASMGIYVFNTNVLEELLNASNHEDFGKQIIPNAIGLKKVYAYFFDGYWADIGTIKSFHEANLDMTNEIPAFNFYSEGHLLYTHPRYLPPSKINNAILNNAVISEGSIIEDATIKRSLIGVRSIVKTQTIIENSYVMGADYYPEEEFLLHARHSTNKPPMGIGHHCLIRNAIIDKNARIGNHVRLINHANHDSFEDEYLKIVDGVIVVPKNTIIPDGYEI